VIAVITFATHAEASCVSVVRSCFCTQPTRVGVLVTEAIDGGTATLRVESSKQGLSVDGGLSLPVSSDEAPGSRWLLLGDERRPIDAAGKVNCPQFPGTPIEVESAASAAVSATCFEEIEAAGFKEPRCIDRGVGCSSAPLALLPLLALGWLLRRRLS
jgi:hypothetical protein